MSALPRFYGAFNLHNPDVIAAFTSPFVANHYGFAVLLANVIAAFFCVFQTILMQNGQAGASVRARYNIFPR